MRMAYLIMAHHDRAGLARLVGALLPAGAPDLVLVHVDARSALWAELRDNPLPDDPRLHVLADPVPVIWGHWSQVEAARRLIAAALELGCDFAHMLSGVDWPAVDRATIIADIAAAPAGTCFIEAAPLVQEERMQGYRLDTRWLRLDPERDRLAYAATWELRRLARIGQRIADRLGLARSRPLGPWHKGSCWWSLPAGALAPAERDLRQLIASGRLHGTVCADEHALPTAIAHRFAGLIAANRRFIDFPPGASSPRVLTREDLSAIRQSKAWFVRKVDAAIDPFFLDLR
jgi:hypothetical protein